MTVALTRSHRLGGFALALVMSAALAGCSATTAPPDSSAPGDDTVVADGEEWIVYQWAPPCGDDPGTDTICLTRPDGSGRHELPLPEAGVAKHPDWSPDGTHLTFTLNDAIWAKDVEGGDARKLAECLESSCVGLDYPAWSPDGQSIAFTRYAGPLIANAPPSSSSIDVVDLGTGAVSTLAQTPTGSLVDQARWNPEGTQLVTQIESFDTESGVEIGAVIATLGVDDGSLTPLTDPGLFATYSDWSPIGDRIVFSTGEYNPDGGPVDLWLMNADGTDQTKIVFPGSDSVQSRQPTWTPDGARILFVEWPAITMAVLDAQTLEVSPFTQFGMSHPRLRPL